MSDAEYCPRCGYEKPRTVFSEDLMHNRYYTDLDCPECGATLRIYRMELADE